MKSKLTTGSGIGTGFSLACCFGLLSLLLGLFGLTTAIAAVNKYGDYVFFPLYSLFATLFISSIWNWKRKIAKTVLILLILVITIWLMTFGIVYTGLIILGIIIGGLLTWKINT
ncbi:hypothetical protein COV18_00715 [Candidatus Woesearchaeota archaeon CG10_big_fil_rev_8_21_14_0_10_37_12]|nr:MAG: hypothetical protein COV18_00715 [Candidatus Woesearchaeota archaeon CG10_big_fil_rev_8_21_14_0_10_37_12]